MGGVSSDFISVVWLKWLKFFLYLLRPSRRIMKHRTRLLPLHPL